MKYQKIANLLDNEVALSGSNKPSKLRKKNWVEINDDIRGAYSRNKQIRFKTAMLRSSLCDYSNAYILVTGNITYKLIIMLALVLLQIILVKK